MAKLTPQFSAATIKKAVLKKMEVFENVLVSRLMRIGEAFITNARNNGDYTDRTGNLRSSIGYIILKNGEQLTSGGFEQIKQGADGPEKGRELIERIASEFPVGFVLIVVAGMEYAAAVEARGFDVLTASGITAENDLKKAMETILKKAA